MNQKLIELFQQWSEAKAKIDKLESEISEIVLSTGEGISVGSTKIRIKKPAKKTDYERAAIDNGVPRHIIDINTSTSTKTSVSWKSVCEMAEIGQDVLDQYTIQGEPYVAFETG